MTQFNGSPLHTAAGGTDDDPPDEELILDDDDSLEEIDMEDLMDGEDDEDSGGNNTTDQGTMGDIEDEGDDSDVGGGLDGFVGKKPDYILTAHAGSAVFCTSFDSTGHKLITGGEDDTANVWDSSSIKTRFPIGKCRGHADSVVSASFSWDSVFFCTCDLAGLVKIWKTSSMENITSFETGDLSWSFWHFASHVLFAGCDDGTIYMWKIPSGECKTFLGSPSKCECACLLPDGKRLAAGYSDGALKLFDLKSGEILQNFVKAGQGESVLCIDRHQTHSIIATGSSDGAVRLYNTQNGKLLHTWQCSPGGSPFAGTTNEGEDEKVDSVESVTFCPNSQLDYLAAGSITGNIAIWDVTAMTERLRMKQDVGLTKIVWDAHSPILYSAGLDGVIREIDARTCKVERVLGRHRSEILDMGISKDGTKLVSGSEDGSAFIYNLR